MSTGDSLREYISKPELNLFISILVPLLALAVMWGVLATRLDHVEKLALGLQEQYKEQSTTNEEIKVKLAEIQKDLMYIRENLDRHLNE